MQYIDIFKAQVERAPQSIALSDEGGSISYVELDRMTDFLASRIIEAGIEEDSFIGVYVAHTKEIMVGALAVLKAGCTFVPLDDSYPRERLDFMAQDCSMQGVLTLESLWDNNPMDMPEDRVFFIGGEMSDVPVRRRSRGDVAFVLYTSGTTGRPKGVVHTQDSLVSMLDWTLKHIPVPMTAGSHGGLVSGYTFIAAALIMFSTLAAGGTLYPAGPSQRLDMRELYKFIVDNEITHIFLSSSLAAAMVESYDLSGTCIMAGGEKLRPFKPIGGAMLVNSYGSTEGVAVCSCPVRGDEAEIPIGRTTPGVVARVIDDEGRDVPDGQVGELIYKAGFLARGYLNLPEQTAAKFRDGYYHTGDRVRRDADGLVYCLGRTDFMVKIRGFRVETGEVEAQVTAACPGLGQVAVVVRNVGGAEHLCCCYEAPAPLSDEDVEALKEKISGKLAAYMVPDYFVHVPQMERNANGKVMRDKLPAPVLKRRKYVSPMTELEQRVADEAGNLLGLKEPISMDESFLDLGGDSLKALQLSQRLSDQGISVQPSNILRLKMISDIAASARVDWSRLWTVQQWQAVQDDFASKGLTIEKVLPLTPAQDDILISHVLDPVSSPLRKVYLFDTQSVVSREALADTLSAIASEFETLRTSVVFHGVTVFQQIVSDRSIPFECIDDESRLGEIYHRQMQIPFDPQYMCPMCVSRVGRRLVVTIHEMGQGMAASREYLLSFFKSLGDKYPEDEALREWIELLSMAGGGDTAAAMQTPSANVLSGIGNPDDVMVYSSSPELPKMMFVHTANTGSEAYYRLADKICSHYSFSVINSWNIYHPEEAVYGIANIARKYIELLRERQPSGPYRLGGWCYGGIIAYEMACQLQKEGEEVASLILFDTHLMGGNVKLEHLTEESLAETDRSYFETCHLFEEMRQKGMLQNLIRNFEHVSYDIVHYQPSRYKGHILYFKPEVTPAGLGAAGNAYHRAMLDLKAGNLESYVADPSDIEVVMLPHEHDLMMDDVCLEISAPIINSLVD